VTKISILNINKLKKLNFPPKKILFLPSLLIICGCGAHDLSHKWVGRIHQVDAAAAIGSLRLMRERWQTCDRSKFLAFGVDFRDSILGRGSVDIWYCASMPEWPKDFKIIVCVALWVSAAQLQSISNAVPNHALAFFSPLRTTESLLYERLRRKFTLSLWLMGLPYFNWDYLKFKEYSVILFEGGTRDTKPGCFCYKFGKSIRLITKKKSVILCIFGADSIRTKKKHQFECALNLFLR